jgi:hypothetical protein
MFEYRNVSSAITKIATHSFGGTHQDTHALFSSATNAHPRRSGGAARPSNGAHRRQAYAHPAYPTCQARRSLVSVLLSADGSFACLNSCSPGPKLFTSATLAHSSFAQPRRRRRTPTSRRTSVSIPSVSCLVCRPTATSTSYIKQRTLHDRCCNVDALRAVIMLACLRGRSFMPLKVHLQTERLAVTASINTSWMCTLVGMRLKRLIGAPDPPARLDSTLAF